jgi:hypothetical protein
MDDFANRGDLSRTPFARVLAGIGRQGLTGLLLIRGAGGEKKLAVERGTLALESESFDEAGFLRFLWTKGEADLIGLARVEDLARREGLSLLRTLSEEGLLDPARLWTALGSFAEDEAFPLFDRDDAEFEFLSLPGLPGRILIAGIDLARLALEGVRRMSNAGLIAGHLPAEGQPLRRLQTGWPDRPPLAPEERYVLGLLEPGATPAELYAGSDLGKTAIQRILFSLLCLGLAGTAAPKPKTGRLPADRSPAELERTFAAFNAKCSFIFKSISKGVGPVASSIIEKSLEEIKSRLDPAFQGLELGPDGRIELKSSLRLNAAIAGEEGRRSLLRSMDEILVAEVLAFKRTLGSDHEAALIRSLDKMGDAP